MPRTILIADESATIRKIVELTFGDSEIRVECAASGSEAVERLDSLRPDLLLVACSLGGLSGYEVCRAVKRSARPVPVVLLAGTFEPLDPVRARECGADGQLTKPFDSSTLRATVASLLAAGPAEPPPPPPTGTPSEPEATPAAVPRLDAAVAPPPEWIEAVAREVVTRLTHDAVREIAWEVVPQLARQLIRERIRELEQQADVEDG